MRYFLRYIYTNVTATDITIALTKARNDNSTSREEREPKPPLLEAASQHFPVLKYHLDYHRTSKALDVKPVPAYENVLTMKHIMDSSPRDLRKAVFKRSKFAIKNCAKIALPQQQIVDAFPILI